MPAKTSQPDPTQIKKKLTQPRPIKKGIVTPRAVLKKPTPAKKQTPTPTPKKFVVPKNESDEVEDEDDGVDEENEEDSKGSQDDEEEVSELKEVKKKKTTKQSSATKKKDVCTMKKSKDEEECADDESDSKDDKKKKKKKKPNHNWTEEQRNSLLNFILDQIALGKGTDSGNLKAEGWTAVRKDMFKRFNINFNDDQVKNQKGAVRKLYIDMEFLLKLSGFGWCAATKMVTADEDTWDELIDAHPERMFATIRKGNNSWYELAQDLFEPSCATGATALLPGQAPPKSEHEDTINVSSDVSGLSTNSVKRRKGIAKTIDVDSSGDDKVEDVKRAARDPPKKQIRENKYNILKNGVASIVDILRGTPSQADIKPDTKPIVPPETKPEPTLTTRQEAIKLMASMYFGKVATIDYI
ncbi:hypothetical protein PSTG_13334 [Puccinia striiformis f. sp. tritici PST-78]|uniref:Myb/SANT-like domain-containing protein n=1 Tax=Puccinia striiformis f. sp. tritici PST-78 TaxID=1165861 RepID=A0A0L0V2S5_9BASI|nr:hypothetical protein PSTG_13334 [Puccinia striiformis f. sp. tritici PST-78]